METQDQPLYNSRIIDNYLRLIRRNYKHLDVHDLLSYAGIEDYEIADHGHWFTQAQVDRFYERLVHLTGNENLAREAGRYAASSTAIGGIKQCILGMVGPAKAYEFISKTAFTLTRSSLFKSTRLSPTRYEITVSPAAGIQEKPFHCENRIGFLESIVFMFNHTFPDIQHPQCLFKGDEACRYVVSWRRSLSGTFKVARNYSIVLTALASPVLLVRFGSLTPVGASLFALVTAVVILAFSCLAEILENRQTRKTLENLKDSSEKLIEQINSNYNNALMTNEIGQAISTQSDNDDVLARVITIIQNRLDFDRGMILLTDQNSQQLTFRHGYGYTAEELELLNSTRFNLANRGSRGIFLVSMQEKKPFLVNTFDEIKGDLSPRSLLLARKLGTQSFICCPIISENESIGILAVDNKVSKRPLVGSDVSLLTGVANVIGISIRNAALIAAKVRQFQSLLQVLAATTDARDFLTAGHSEKVTEYAIGICRELGSPADFTEVVRVAALLHDYGKVAIPDAILKKDGRLTAEEYDIVKTHAQRSREILEQIHFEGMFRTVPEIAAAHHERIDGSGYPLGLRGNEIPLGAKIIAVADFFEAITSKRHYREPMRLDNAFALLQEGIGTRFEKNIVEAFIRYYRKAYPGATEIETRRRMHQPARRARAPLRTAVSVRNGAHLVFGTSADVSLGGMYVSAETTVCPETQVEISFSMPGGEGEVISTRGRIAWVNSPQERKKPLFPVGFGVQFLDLKASQAETIQDLLLDLNRNRLRRSEEQLHLDMYH